jgi:hypothetical protein
MKLYIRIVDNEIYEHPILEDNFKQAFPDIDTENLPAEFAVFERVDKPEIGLYEIYEGVSYEWSENIVKDVHHVRNMTDEEKINLQNDTKETWAVEGFASWIFNEETCSFDPPVPYPDDGSAYAWSEEHLDWLLS